LPIADGPNSHRDLNLNPPFQTGGFFLGFAMRGKLWTGRSGSLLLGATVFVGREN
jgi:hypothetical protein